MSGGRAPKRGGGLECLCPFLWLERGAGEKGGKGEDRRWGWGRGAHTGQREEGVGRSSFADSLASADPS